MDCEREQERRVQRVRRGWRVVVERRMRVCSSEGCLTLWGKLVLGIYSSAGKGRKSGMEAYEL